MFKRAILILRRIEDALPMSSYLKLLNVEEGILAALDVSGIPVDVDVVDLTESRWLEEASIFFKESRFEIKTLKYSGDRLPAEIILEFAREKECDVIIVPSTKSGKPLTPNLASTLVSLSDLPVMVVPLEGSRPV